MGVLKTSANVQHIEGYSVRAEGAAILIVLGEAIVAMFEMQTNVMTVSEKDISKAVNNLVTNLTKGWGTDIEYMDHTDFQALVYNNFKIIV